MTAKLPTFAASVLLLACSHDPPAADPGATVALASTQSHGDHPAPDKHEAPSHGVAPAHGADGKSTPKAAPNGKKHEESGYAVPFVWETSKTDPLAIARGHLRDILASNAAYVKEHSKKDLSAEAGARTTLLTCSDAALQLTALDSTAENDMFVTRNWGNLLDPALGSITYGIEELQTPVLLIVGHTGCEAVKAAIDGTSFSKPIRSLASKLKIKAPKGDQDESQRHTDAVIYNVNRQVSRAVQRFEPLVRTGALTVVGAVYDPENVLEQGFGRVSIINVNSVTDPSAMRAFVAAVASDDKIVMQQPEAKRVGHDNEEREPHDALPERHDVSADHAHAGAHSVGGGAPPATVHEGTPGHDHPTPSSHRAPTPGASRPKHDKSSHAGLPRIDNLEASLVDRPHPAPPDHHEQ